MLAAAQLLGERVIQLRKGLLLDSAQRHANGGFLTGELGLRVVVWKLDGGLPSLVDKRSRQDGQQLGQQHTVLELRLHGLARLGFDHRAVRLDLHVDDGDVPHPRLPLNRRDLGERFPQVFEPALEHLVGDLDRLRWRCQPRSVPECDLRHHADGCLQPRGAAALELDHLDVRVVDGVDRLLAHRLLHDLGDDGLDHLLS